MDYFGGSVALSGGTALVGAPIRNGGQGSAYLFLEGIAPTTTTGSLASDDRSGWITHPQTVLFTASDAGGSGLATTSYTLDGGAPQAYTGPFDVSGQGSHRITYWSTDNAGNSEAAHAGYVNIDTTSPSTTASGATPSGWSRTPVTVSFSGSDALSGWAKTEYSLAGGPWYVGSSCIVSDKGRRLQLSFHRCSRQRRARHDPRGAHRRPGADLAGDEERDRGQGQEGDAALQGQRSCARLWRRHGDDHHQAQGQDRQDDQDHRTPTNKARSYSFKVTLKKGGYTWTVKAIDIAGNVGKASAAKRLIVR